jgi:hypothetical protein
MKTSALNRKSVQSIWEKYQQDILTKPRKFKGKEGDIQINLPLDLAWDWSNKAAGASGYLEDGSLRPAGIRLTRKQVREQYGDQDTAMNTIMSSADSLYNFILNSPCDGGSYIMDKLSQENTEVEMIDPVAKQTMIEMALIRLAISTNDNVLARQVISGSLKKYPWDLLVDNLSV